jgi:hypothetical protein
MLFLFGIRVARIGRYRDRTHICYPCKAFDRDVQVLRSYFHFCLIPVFPTGAKQWGMRCRNCGDETLLENVKKEFEAKARTPFYLYSAIYLFIAIAGYWFYWNKNTQIRKMEFVTRPAAGDVYTMAKKGNDEATYCFLKIISVRGDSVTLIRNQWDYGQFVSGLKADDYFGKGDSVRLAKKELGRMAEEGEIYSVERGYGEGSSFNRVK